MVQNEFKFRLKRNSKILWYESRKIAIVGPNLDSISPFIMGFKWFAIWKLKNDLGDLKLFDIYDYISLSVWKIPISMLNIKFKIPHFCSFCYSASGYFKAENCWEDLNTEILTSFNF